MRRPATEVLALVGMRSGSRGVPDKNIRRLAGRPLFAWIVDASRRAERVTRLVVSTDSDDYARLAREHGAEVPALRPAELAGPESTDVEFIVQMLDTLEAVDGYVPDVVLRLLATCPLQAPEDIDAVVNVLDRDPGASSAMVIAEARQHPMKALRVVADGGAGRVVPYVSGHADHVEPTARQGYEPAYFRANVIASRITTIRTTGSLTGDHVAYHVVPQDRAIDIDTELDFEIAEFLLERRHRAAPGQS